MPNILSLFLILGVLQTGYGVFTKINNAPKHVRLTNVTSQPLILTDYIRQNKTAEARAAAQVQYDGFQNVTSYSGFFTVEECYNSNLFFWFFPAVNDYENAPVVLWLEGGPGAPSVYSIFEEHGPFSINEDLNVISREFSWNKDHSVLYIDSPVGTGFSFTSEGFVQDQTKVGAHLYIALQQFFAVFSELQDKPFFTSGESYGGKYVPAISYTIHKNNPSADIKINYQGSLIGSGWSNPLHMFVYSDYLYQLGLVDVLVRDEIKVVEAEAVKLIEAGNFTAATQKVQDIILGHKHAPTIYHDATGLSNIYNYLLDADDEPSFWEDFVRLDEIREALHVGAVDFGGQTELVYANLWDDITKSVAPWITELLSHYRIILFGGQLDVIVGYPLTENYLRNLDFSAAEEYKTAKRNIWRLDGKVAGYVKKAGNLTDVLVRNAGHMASIEQPKAVYDLLYKFVRNIDLS